MDNQYVNFEKKENIAIVTISKEKSLNALSYDVLIELKVCLLKLEKDEDIRCIIITGSGKAFVAGADIEQINSSSEKGAFDYARYGQDTLSYIENFPLPVIAAINGFALGGGCELAMSCDIRIASEKARFGLPEVSLGIIPGNGGTQRLPRLVGKGMAKYLIMTGKHIKAEEAKQIGLADVVVPADELLDEAIKTAQTICQNSPDAITLAKQAVNMVDEVTLENGILKEADLYLETFRTENRKIGMTAFLKKEKATFK